MKKMFILFLLAGSVSCLHAGCSGTPTQGQSGRSSGSSSGYSNMNTNTYSSSPSNPNSNTYNLPGYSSSYTNSNPDEGNASAPHMIPQSNESGQPQPNTTPSEKSSSS